MLQQTPTTKALQVINFNSCELRASVDSSFSCVGPLKVLYLPSYDKFMLGLNDWNYVLSKHLPTSTSVKSHENLCTYTLPGPKGSFALKLHTSPNSAAVHNLNTILSSCSSLHQKEDAYNDFHNTSIDVKCMDDHPIFEESQEHNLLGDNIKDHKLTTRDLIDDEQTETFKEEQFFTSTLHNPNIAEIKDINNIKKTPETEVEVFHLPTNEVVKMIEIANEISAKLDDLSDSHLGLGYDNRATADTLTFTLEKIIGDEHSAILSSPGESRGSKNQSLFLGLSALGDKNEEELQNDIQVERGIQEEARRLQEEAIKYELDNIMKERKARDELVAESMFEDYHTVVMSETATKIMERLNQISEELEVVEEELMTGRFEDLDREKELKSELERLNAKIVEKERLIEAEREVLRGKERALENLKDASERNLVVLENKCDVEKLKLSRREMELKERFNDIQEMVLENKSGINVENKKGRMEEGERKKNIKRAQRALKHEEKEYRRMKKMLEKEIEIVEKEKKMLENSIRDLERQFDEGQEALENKERELENEKSYLRLAEENFKELVLHEEMELKRLYDLEMTTEMEREELKKRENLIQKDIKDLTLEQTEFNLRQKDFNDILQERLEKIQAEYDNVLEMQKMNIDEINEFQEAIENEKMQLEDDIMKSLLRAEDQEKDLEGRRIENELKKAKMELLQQKENVIFERIEDDIARKKEINEESSCMVMYKKQKIARECEEDFERRENLLWEIKMQQEVIFELGKDIIKGHQIVQQEIEKAEMELSEPMDFQLELEKYFMRVQTTECMEDCP